MINDFDEASISQSTKAIVKAALNRQRERYEELCRQDAENFKKNGALRAKQLGIVPK